MAKKATHTGHCQVCGHHQKLPNGLLSLHGYTKTWGFFNGTWYGAGHLPFEKSKDLIEGAIKRETENRDRLSALSAEYKAGKQLDDNKAWDRVYHSASGGPRRSRGDYVWEHVEVKVEEIKYHDGSGSYVVFWTLPENAKAWNREGLAFDCHTLDQYRTKMNTRYAAHLDKTVEDITRYIAWQQERIKSWKETELTPV
jgi:hypothetical protein